jgi:hypothetical protein
MEKNFAGIDKMTNFAAPFGGQPFGAANAMQTSIKTKNR